MTTDVFESLDDGTDHDYEYVDDSSGLEAPSDADLHVADSISQARRKRYESKTAAAVSARKYKFRKRMLMAMGVLLGGHRRCRVPGVADVLVGVRLRRRGDRPLPRLPAPPDSHRGAGAAPSRTADGAVAARRREHPGPRVRRRAVATASSRRGGAWRSTTRIRSSSTSTTPSTPMSTTCRGRPASSSLAFSTSAG